jgi:hypothetical protein
VFRRVSIVVVALGLSAGAAIPSTASAAVKWNCSATPLSGTILGQSLDVPVAGTLQKACDNLSTATGLSLPNPLSTLIHADLVNGITAINADNVFAGAGLANIKVGSLPIPIGDINIPDSLKKIDVTLPNQTKPVAEVDLTPAIDAIKSLPSRDLLDAGVLYSNVVGSCSDATPKILGASKILDASVLGLPVDVSRTVDSAVNLVDTSHIALDTLDLSLAHITLLGGTTDVNTGQILDALKPILDKLPPIAIPPTLAQVKLTPDTQETVNGVLTQRALRAQVSLLGKSIVDLSVGQAAIGARAACTRAAPAAALQCTKRKLTLIDVVPDGDRVRLYGAADKSLAGKTVNIFFKATHQVVAKVKVNRDGSFTTTAPMPAAGIRATNRARYIAKAGGEKSLNLKLMRRMVVSHIASHNGRVTIVGHVVKPLAQTPQTITLKRRVTCRRLQVVKRFKPNADGTFKVTVRSPRNLAATVYRLQTRVRQAVGNPKLYPTFTLPRAVNL